MSLRLIIEDDEGTTTIVPLGKDAITIGRQQGNTIQLTEKNVSRRHARLYLDDGDAWIIEDLGSYNGVKVNGVAIEGRINLKEGDVVQIGDYHLALTEDVDKRTLNFSGAANDPGTAAAAGAEPLLASSSTELPRLSPDEVAMLQSGPQAVSNPMLDSGAIPASGGGYEERRKGGSGFLVGFGAVVVIALIIGVVWFASSGGSSEEADTAKVASAGETKPTPTPAKAVAPTPPPDEPEAPVAPADPSDSAGEEDEPIDVVDDPPVEDPPTPAADEGGEEEVVIGEDDPPPPATPTPPPTNNKPKNRRQPKRNPQSNSPKSTAPKEPAVDADALFSEARGLAFSNPKRCFDLAKKSYQAKRSGAVAQLMASCACRMGDASKAKYALGKVGPSKRDGVVKMCDAKGVKL